MTWYTHFTVVPVQSVVRVQVITLRRKEREKKKALANKCTISSYFVPHVCMCPPYSLPVNSRSSVRLTLRPRPRPTCLAPPSDFLLLGPIGRSFVHQLFSSGHFADVATHDVFLVRKIYSRMHKSSSRKGACEEGAEKSFLSPPVSVAH